MKRLIQTVLAATLMLLPVQGAFAQIVSVDKNYTIKAVDLDHNRLTVKYLNAAHEPVREELLVECDGQTQVTLNGHPASWKALRPNMEIEVKGGLEVSGHIHAKTILVRRMHV